MRLDDFPQIKELSVADKMALVEELWDSIAADQASVPVPQSHLDELERRIEYHAAHPEEKLLTLEEFKAKLRGWPRMK